MKKTLLTILAAVAMTFAMTSCDPTLDLDGKSWKKQKAYDPETPAEKATVVLEGYTDDYYFWTDEEAAVIRNYSAKIVGGDTVFSFTGIEKETINYTLYIAADKDNDSRGRVTVYRDKKVVIQKDKAPETNPAYGLLKLTVNEPKSDELYPKGDYTVTDIWPMRPKADKDLVTFGGANDKVDGKYEVKDTLKFKNVEIKNGETVWLPVTAGYYVLGVFQKYRNQSEPDKTGHREKVLSKYHNEDESVNTAKVTSEIINSNKVSIYRLGKKVEGETETITAPAGSTKEVEIQKYAYAEDAKPKDVLDDYLDVNEKCMFGEDIEIIAHKTTSINTYDIDSYIFYFGLDVKKDKTRYRNADGDYVTEVELTAGSFEK